jgi:hypothetical protein
MVIPGQFAWKKRQSKDKGVLWVKIRMLSIAA